MSSGMVAENSMDWRCLGSMRHELAHVADEAHVQHAVGFVDDEGVHRIQPHMLLLHQVEQAARRRDQDVDAVLGAR